ncbi:hypothetical protein DENSPDRAFT_447780 [Dentipellis sp. KUC8613]|nr:hypothetical protein DENSPDRAFT_447780 [Dentipellis sp. KUC8613]
MCGEKYYEIVIAQLWSVSTLYGLYIALFTFSIYVLVYRRSNTFFLAASVALFVLTTANMGMLLARTVGEPIITSSSVIYRKATLVSCNPESQTSERLREALRNNLISIMMNLTSTCTTLIADGVFMFRCVRLWPYQLRHWFTIPFGLLLLAGAAFGGAVTYFEIELYLMARQETSFDDITASVTSRWIKTTHTMNYVTGAWYILETVTNSVVTFLIALHIWIMVREVETACGKAAGAPYRAVMPIIIETGFLISASQLAETCICLINSVEEYGNLISGIGLMLTVISPTMIIARVGMGKGFDSLVETSHHREIPRGAREIQLRPIQFAEHRISNFGADEVMMIGDARSTSSSEPSGVDAKVEKINIV